MEKVTERLVWIAVRDMGSEGMSEPLRAFADKQMADLFKLGQVESWGTSIKIFEMPIIERQS